MKIQEDSFDQSPQSFSKPISKNQESSKNNRKYNKITHDLRMKFLDKIFFENKSIKKAAQELNINYSSAKTILNLHRKKQRFQQQPLASASDISSESDSAKMCSFSTQTLQKKQQLELIITLGGRLMNSNKIESTTTSPTLSSEKISLPQSNVASSVNLFNQSVNSLSNEEIFLQQQQQQQLQANQQQQLLLKLLQEQQIQEQQRLQQQQLQQFAMNPEFYSLLIEKQKQDQQQFVLAQLLQQQQQKNQSFGLF